MPSLTHRTPSWCKGYQMSFLKVLKSTYPQAYWRVFHFKNRVGSFLAGLFGLETIYYRKTKVSEGAFCDYCSCAGCQTGNDSIGLTQYECADGSHICDVCLLIEPCVTTVDWRKKRGGSWFCADVPKCPHKPPLKSDKPSGHGTKVKHDTA